MSNSQCQTVRKPLCFIPARGGSKRLVGKNLAMLRGKPLLHWTISCARESGLFEDILVSSEDDAILKAAEAGGAVPVLRPKELGGDEVTLLQVCLATVPELASRQGASDLYLMLPTSPLRRSETVRRAWNLFVESGSDALMSVLPLEEPPQWALKVEGERIHALYPDDYETPRQSLIPAYKHDGGHLIVRIESLVRDRSYMAGDVLAFKVAPEEGVDVNTPHDLLWAEYLIGKLVD